MALPRWDSIRQDADVRAPQWLKWCSGAAAVFLIVLFAVSAAQRVHTPFELEWHEGFAVQTIEHIVQTGKLYPAPHFSFVPYLYSPGFYYTAALVMKAVGHGGFAVARSVSIASCLLTFLVLFLMVRRETGSALGGLLAAGLYAGAYPYCQAWFDIARLDSFYVLAIVCAVYATRWFHPVVAALVWVIAIQCKQPVLPVAFVMLCWNWRAKGKTFAGLATLFIALGSVMAIAAHYTGDWYLFYMFQVPKAVSDILLRPLFLFIPTNLLAPFGIACALILIAAWNVLKPGLTPRATFYLLTSSMFAVTWFQMGHGGSVVNVLMPAYSLLAMLFGISAVYLWRNFPSGAGAVVALAATLQLIACTYNPGQWKPTPYQRSAASSLQTVLKSLPGDVYDAWHPYDAIQAGKPGHVDFNSLQDTLRALKPAQAEQLRSEIANSICDGTSAVLVDHPQGMNEITELLHRGPAFIDRFSTPQLYPGANVALRPAWIVYAKQGSNPALCAAPASGL